MEHVTLHDLYRYHEVQLAIYKGSPVVLHTELVGRDRRHVTVIGVHVSSQDSTDQ